MKMIGLCPTCLSNDLQEQSVKELRDRILYFEVDGKFFLPQLDTETELVNHYRAKPQFYCNGCGIQFHEPIYATEG